MKIKIKINRLCLILICAGLLRGDSNDERKYNHYPEPVNIIKNKNRLPSARRRHAPPRTRDSLPNSAPSMINKLASSSLTVSSQHD